MLAAWIECAHERVRERVMVGERVWPCVMSECELERLNEGGVSIIGSTLACESEQSEGGHMCER